MKLGVYSRLDGVGPLILVALCLRPSIEAERLYGELHFQGAVDTDELAPGIDWAMLLGCVLDASYAAVDRARAAPILALTDVRAPPTGAPPRAVARKDEAGMGLSAAGLPTAYPPTHKPP